MPKHPQDDDDWWRANLAETVELLRGLRHDKLSAAQLAQLRQRLKEVERQLKAKGWEGTERSTVRRDLTTVLNDLERLGRRPEAYRALMRRLTRIIGGKLMGPIEAIRFGTAYRDLVVALMRIGAALALEARFAAGEEGQCLSQAAEERARNLVRISESDLPYPAFPHLAGIYASRQLSWWFLEMRPSARAALLCVDAPKPSKDGGFLSFLLLTGMSLVPYADAPHVVALALQESIPDRAARQWVWEQVGNPALKLSVERQLLSVLAAYWGHVTGQGHIALGFCSHCGRFFGGRSRAKRYCSASCRVAFNREIGSRRATDAQRRRR